MAKRISPHSEFWYGIVDTERGYGYKLVGSDE